ncbi:MAG: FosX/FosE/FosI family fosfomycin resistance hydrolase [Acidobacteriota bacterium]
MIEGLSHATFVVRDLERTTRFLVELLAAEEVYSSGDATFSIAREKFFLIGGVWVAIMEGEPRNERSYDHVAFKIRDEDFDTYLARARDLGLELREPRPRVEGEGRSLYLYDHDNHLFELHTGTLEQRLARYRQP